MQIAYEVISIVLGLGLVFFLLNKALKNTNYKVKGFTNITVGIILAIIFGIALWFDYRGGNIITLYYPYFLFIITTLAFGIGYGYNYLIYKRGRSPLRKKTISKYYFTDYIYMFYRYDNIIYLQNKKNKYFGLSFKLKPTDYHDSFIMDVNKKYNINSQINVQKIGKLTSKEKRKIYHCYVVNLFDDLDIKNLEKVNAYKLTDYQMDDFDKNLMFRMILRDQFDIDN